MPRPDREVAAYREGYIDAVASITEFLSQRMNAFGDVIQDEPARRAVKDFGWELRESAKQLRVFGS